jgi:hypothetical protein
MPRATDPVAPSTVAHALDDLAARPAPGARRRRSGDGQMPDWWPGQETRIDAAGVVRRPESWLVRSRFAIACTVACLALIAAIFLGTVGRGPAGTSPWGLAMAGTRSAGHAADGGSSAPGGDAKSHKKSSVGKHAPSHVAQHHSAGQRQRDEDSGSSDEARSGKHRGD